MTTGPATASNKSALLQIRFQKGLNWRGVAQAKFWNMVSKDMSFGERHKERTVAVSPGNGGSPDFLTALANRGPGTEVTFTLQVKSDYVILSVEEKLFKTKNSLMIKSAITDQLERKGKEHGMMISRRVWGENGSALGRLTATSTVTTATVTLRSKHQVKNFYKGMIVEAASDDGSGQTPAAKRVGTLTVDSIDPPNAQVTFTVHADDGIGAIAASDYLFQKNEYGQCWSGILGWCPTTAPTTGDYFLGIDRSAYGDTQRLAGFRGSVARADKSSNVANTLAEASPFGIMVDTIFVAPTDYAKWMDEMGNNRQQAEVTSKTVGVSFKGVVVHTPSGDTTVLSEPMCPEGVWVGTNMDNWKVLSIGEIPTMPGPSEWMKEATADARQARLASYACLDCEDPGANVVGTW